ITSEGTKRVISFTEIMKDFSYYKADQKVDETIIRDILHDLINHRIIREDVDNHFFELRHDILASRIYEWLGHREKEFMEIHQIMSIRLKEYEKRHILLNRDDLEFIKPFEKLLNNDPRFKDFISQSITAIRKLAAEEDHQLKEKLRIEQFNMATALLHMAHIFTDKNDWKLSLLYTAGSLLYQAKSEKYIPITIPLPDISLYSEKEDDEVYSFRDYKGAMAFSSDSHFFVCGDVDNRLILWDMKNGKARACLKGHRKTITSAVYNSSGTLLASGSEDKTILIWDMKSNRNIQMLHEHEKFVNILQFKPGTSFLASGSSDTTIRLWDLDNDTVQTLLGHKDEVSALTFNSDGTLMASGGYDNSIIIWNMDAKKESFRLSGHERFIHSIAISPDSRVLASCGEDEEIIIWNLSSRKEIARLSSPHGGPVYSLAFSPDSRFLLTGGWDNKIRLWDCQDYSEINLVSSFKSPVTNVIFSPDGRYFAGGSKDKTIKIWNTEHLRIHLSSPYKEEQVENLLHNLDIGYKLDGIIAVKL
ncbi:MAG: WD40 repeat domain-containing protein, partial [Candidatus Pacearchaeota archaeon]|nr:WD40 repeat domain-containing protein [Candidatus Pacearchaeota archaeon]